MYTEYNITIFANYNDDEPIDVVTVYSEQDVAAVVNRLLETLPNNSYYTLSRKWKTT